MIEIIQDYWLMLLVGAYPDGPLGGLAMTIVVAILSLALTFPSALLMALARISTNRFISYPAAGFVYLVRGMPLLMLLFWIYFFLPIVLGFPISPFWSLISAIVIFQTAYLSEVIRAAIIALPLGQTEAAKSLGLGHMVTMRKVILPQALYNAVPGILNQLTAIIKETSLGFVLSVSELTYAGGQINSQLLTKPMQVFVLRAAIYFSLCFSLTKTTGLLETRITKRRTMATT